MKIAVKIDKLTFDRKCSEAGVQGLEGQIKKSGCTFNYSFNLFTSTLSIDVVDKPWYAPESTVEQQVRTWLSS